MQQKAEANVYIALQSLLLYLPPSTSETCRAPQSHHQCCSISKKFSCKLTLGISLLLCKVLILGHAMWSFTKSRYFLSLLVSLDRQVRKDQDWYLGVFLRLTSYFAVLIVPQQVFYSSCTPLEGLKIPVLSEEYFLRL